MLRNKLIKVVICISSLLMLSSCGSDNAGGGAGEFTTVILSANTKTDRLEADVITGNVCPATNGTFKTETVDVDVISKRYPNVTIPALPVRIYSYTVSYTPRTQVSPSLPVQSYSSGAVIDPGTTTTIPIPVATDILKYKLVNDFNLQPCSATMYEYHVTITFNGTEIGGSGPSQSFSTNVDVAFADRQGT